KTSTRFVLLKRLWSMKFNDKLIAKNLEKKSSKKLGFTIPLRTRHSLCDPKRTHTITDTLSIRIFCLLKWMRLGLIELSQAYQSSLWSARKDLNPTIRFPNMTH